MLSISLAISILIVCTDKMLARSTPKMTAVSKAGQNKISPKAGKKKNSPKVGKKRIVMVLLKVMLVFLKVFLTQ
jgi:hypothetical protein